MYLNKIRVQNIKSLKDITCDFSGNENYEGWHVILGDNGAGKTSFAKCVLATTLEALMKDPVKEVYPISTIFPNTPKWIRYNEEFIRIDALLREEKNILKGFSLIFTPTQSTSSLTPFKSSIKHFTASFGATRKFSGGDDFAKNLKDNKLLEPHFSLLRPDSNLSSSVEWLKRLRFKELEGNGDKELLGHVKNFINSSGIFPSKIQLTEINSDEVIFEDEKGTPVDIHHLSDGYQSVLSMTLEIVRLILEKFSTQETFAKQGSKTIIRTEGIVIIDEVDAHLHPTWQVKIGEWFTEYFPRIQFIVTTHSPLICRAAKNGTIHKLVSEGFESTQCIRIEGVEFDRLIYGNILEAYGTEVFGEKITSSEESQKLRTELASLNKKSLLSQLNKEEKERRLYLQQILIAS